MSTKIFLIDQGIGAEAIAAVQSYYSRDPGSAYEHVKKALEEDVRLFLEKYYKKGYAHKSIAQCTTITLFIEGISFLGAKAFQDSPYYNGQEASTRFIKFDEQGFANPGEEREIEFCLSDIIEGAREGLLEDALNWLKIPVEKSIILEKEKWPVEMEAIKDNFMNFYTTHFPTVYESIKTKNPIKEGQRQDVYEKAVYAKTCDILRGYLPAGMKTLLSWHTTLDHANDVLKLLKYHPATEVREVARGVLKALVEKYPETFVEETTPEIESHLKLLSDKFSYYEPTDWRLKPGEVEFDTKLFSRDILLTFKDVLSTRPKKGLCHRMLGEAGLIGLRYLMDFGSVRDILRHRPGINQVPLLTVKYGFEKWYIKMLPGELPTHATNFIKTRVRLIKKIKGVSKYDLQYVIPLGFLSPLHHLWPFNQVLYIAELRTGNTVHPTVQSKMGTVAQWVNDNFGNVLNGAFYPNVKLEEFSYKRGTQTNK